MDILQNLGMGFQVALLPENLLFCLLGAAHRHPRRRVAGIGPVTTIAMLLPLTFKMPAVGALIMLSGIYYGAHHAGSTTAIMLNMPGEPSSVVICFDGHPMARQGPGRAGAVPSRRSARSSPAASASVIALFFAGAGAGWRCCSGRPNTAAMIVMALVTASVLSGNTHPDHDRRCRCSGCCSARSGRTSTRATMRFTFGIAELADGLNFVAVAVGLFAFAEIILQLGRPERAAASSPPRSPACCRPAPTSRASWEPILRGTALGAVLGIFPGTGPLVSSFASYALERRLARDRRASARARSRAWPGPRRPTTPRRSRISSRC